MIRVFLLLSFMLTTCCDGSEETPTEDEDVEHHHHVVPQVKVPLPLDDWTPHKPLGSGDLDYLLSKQSPGQFFSKADIDEISRRHRRKKRQVDRDVCCKTRLWVGTAPRKLTDIVYKERVTVLRGSKLQQAYSRGDCHSSANGTVSSSFCPSGGKCRQKYRLKMLWVRSANMAELRYFLINSHCAYEQV